MIRLVFFYIEIFFVSKDLLTHASCCAWIHSPYHQTRGKAARNPDKKISIRSITLMHSHESNAHGDGSKPDSISRISPRLKKLFQDQRKSDLLPSETYDDSFIKMHQTEIPNNQEAAQVDEHLHDNQDSTAENGLYRVIVEREHWAQQAAVRARTDPADGDNERRLLEAKIARAEKLFVDANRLARQKAREAEEAAVSAQKAQEHLQNLKLKLKQCFEQLPSTFQEPLPSPAYPLIQSEDILLETSQATDILENPQIMLPESTKISRNDISNPFKVGIRPRNKADLSLPKLDKKSPGGYSSRGPRIVLFELDGAICESFGDTSGPPFRLCTPACIKDNQENEIIIQKGAIEVFKTLASLDRSNLHVAILSRITNQGWTEEFLESILITKGTSMRDLVDFVVIQSGLEKTRQLSETLRAVMTVSSIQNLKRRTKVEYNQMLFFGKESRVCRDLTSMGITSIRVPYGISPAMWEDGLKTFAED